MLLNNGLTKRTRKKSNDTLREVKNPMTPNQWDIAKAVLTEKFIAIQACLNKQVSQTI